MGRLPDCGPCSVEVVHDREIPVRHPLSSRPGPVAGWRPLPLKGRPYPRVEARAVEGPAWSDSEPSDEARLEVLELVGPEFFPFCLFLLRTGQGGQPLAHDVKQSKSVIEARAVEGPAWSVREPSDEARLEVLELVGPEFLPPCLFLLRTGQGSQPVAHDVKQSKSVVEARAVEGPAWSASEPSDEARLEVLARDGPVCPLLAFRGCVEHMMIQASLAAGTVTAGAATAGATAAAAAARAGAAMAVVAAVETAKATAAQTGAAATDTVAVVAG
jgi:hypothetical protein